jgi:hypothetical protein
MSDPEKKLISAAVRRLFARIRSGEIVFTDFTPEMQRLLGEVRLDRDDEPIYATVDSAVSSLAVDLLGVKLERDADERRRSSPVHDYLVPLVVVNHEVIEACKAARSFSPLAFELYKETVAVLAVCSAGHLDGGEGGGGLARNQAICAGLLLKVAKFMTSVASLVSLDAERADVVYVLNRTIMESAVNLRFLLLKNEGRVFDQFVQFSLAPERELYDQIQANIERRHGEILPIERRMLRSITRVCGLSGITISDVSSKAGDWGGGLRNRLIALGEGERYASFQRVPSHAVHGTWVDLVQNHLTHAGGRFEPKVASTRVDCRQMLPVCMVVLAAARAYVESFFPPLPELDPLCDRITSLEDRIATVDREHEIWLSTSAEARGGATGAPQASVE